MKEGKMGRHKKKGVGLSNKSKDTGVLHRLQVANFKLLADLEVERKLHRKAKREVRRLRALIILDCDRGDLLEDSNA